MDTKRHPRYALAEAMTQIYDSKLTTTSGGNISIKDTEGNIWITPSAIDKGSLKPTDIVKVNSDGTVDGSIRPSSELPFHQAIYEQRPDIKSIIHAHPPALVAFSIVRKTPDLSIIPQAKHLCGEVGYASYGLPGSKDLGNKIALEFGNGYHAVIMENHGTVVGGKNLSDAFMRFETLEFCAKTIIKASSIGKLRYLSDEQTALFENIDHQLSEFVNKEITTKELWIREEIVKIIQRACRQELMISSYGTISARLTDDSFLITPTGFNRRELKPSDLVLIKNNQIEKGKNPSKAVHLHRDLYKKHKYLNCVISTQSPFATAFCVTHKIMDTRTIPESYVLLEDIPLMDYETVFLRPDEIVQKIGRHTPIILLENDSILVTGTSIFETFDRLEVAEFSAKSLIESQQIGSLVPIGDQELEDLKEKFLQD